MTDQDEGYGQDTSQEQNDTGGPEIPKTPETPKIGERVRNFFGGNKREKNPKQETPQPQEEPKPEQPKPRKYKDIWSMYETDAYDENVPWQKEVKERMQADPEFKERWGKFNGWFSSGVKGNPKGYSKIKEFNEDRSDEEKNWRRYKKAYGLSQDDDIDFGTDDYDRPIADAKGFKDLFEYSKDPTVVFGGDFGRDGFNDFWDTRGRYNKFNTTPYSVYADNPTYNNWYWSRNPFRLFKYKSSTRADATDDDRRMGDLSELMNGNRWGGGSDRSARLTNRGEFDDISANLYQAKRVRDIFGDEEDPDFFKFMDTIRDSEDPKDRALYDLYWRGMPGMPSEKDYDRLKEDYYHYREQQHGVGRDGKPINPQQEQPQPGPTQEPSQTTEAGKPMEDVSATVDGKPVNAEIVTEDNKLPVTRREGVQDTSQEVTPYREPRETYVEPDNHPGAYTGAPKELGSGDASTTALALSGASPGGNNNPPQTPSGAAPYDLKAERNALAKQHAAKFLNAFAQTAAEMGGQMASKGWDLAGNIVKMTFTQPHVMSSTSRMIGTAMSALQTAGDFADRSVQKYGIDVNADPNLMKNTIRYKLYKREAEMGKNTVGNTFRTISESLGNMGLQDASQMTPDQLDQHVQDMRAEADRLTQALKDPKLSNSERSLIKAQAQHLQGYMDGLAKQGAGMAQDQRIAARRQKRQDLATRKQNYQVLADGSPNPYREALEWADPRFGIEVDPQTGRPTNPSAYNRMLNAVITQHQNEAAAAERVGKKLDPAREKWFNDLQNRIHSDIQAMKQDKAENPLRGRAEIYARIGRVAPGFEKYIDNIEKTGTYPSNTTQSTRAIRKVLADYLTELKAAGKVNSPEYNHAKALLTSMDKYNNMKKLMSRIASLYPTGMERARKLHELANDQFVGETFTDDGKIKDYMTLVQTYANLMKVLPRDPVEGGKFNPSSRKYVEAEKQFNDDLTYFINKWFPDGSIARNKDDNGQPGNTGGNGKGGTPGGAPSLDDFFNDDDENDPNEEDDFYPEAQNPYEWWVERQKAKAKVKEQVDPESGDDIDQFIAEALRRIGMGEPFEEETPQPENPNPAPQPPPEGPSPQPPSQQDQDFNAKFGKWKDIKEFLYERGLIQKASDRLSVAEYNALRDEFIKQGVSPEVFDNSGFAKKHLPIVMLPQREQAMIGMNGLSKKNLAWKKNSAKMFDENPDVEALVAKKVRGEPVTSEEELKIQQTMVDYGIINSIRIKKTPKGDVPPGQEQPETPVEEEAGGENDILPSVRSNNIIPFEVSSQFKKRKNIEDINAGLEAINDKQASPKVRSDGYDSLLFGLTDELGADAVLKDYSKLIRDGLLNGSPRAMQMMADSVQDPDEKLKVYLASRFAAPGSNTVSKNITDFFNQNKGQYDSTAYTPYLNRITEELKKDPTPEKRAEIVNSILDGDLDPSFKLHKEGEKEGDETPSEEEAVDPAKFAEGVVGSLDPSLFPSGETDETPVDQNGTDQFESEVSPEEQTVEEPEKESTGPETVESFEQDDNSPKGLFFPENSPYKDFRSMAEAMGEELGITINTKQKKAREAIDSWLTSHNIGYENGVDADSLKDEIVTYLRKNRLISTKEDTDRKDKDRKVDPVLEEAKFALIEGPAADKDSISKDKKAVTNFKARIRKKYADERDRTRVLGLFDDFMKDYEANLKEQYSNHGDMAWRAQAIADFLKWEQLSLEDRKKLTPREKSGKKNGDKNNKASDEEIHYTPLDDVPKYDPSKRDDFINELGEFGKYASEGRLKGAYIATAGAHDKALNTIQSAISDIDKEIAQRENSRGKEGWTLQDEDNLEGLYNQRSVLGDKKRSWEKSKELVEYNDKFANVYGVFSELSDRARNNEAVSADELKSLEDGISTLSDDDQKMFAPLMDYLKSKTSKFVKDSYIKDYAALQEELEKLKNDSESLKKERDLDEVKSSIDEMFEGFKAGHLEVNKETSKTVEDLIEKLPNKDKDSFSKKFEEIKKNDLRNRIRKEGGFKEGSDPTKWLKEISECTDADTLNKKVRAYEHYIESLPKNAKSGEYKSLDRAKDRADALINPRSREEVAAELIKKIQENGYHEFDVNAKQYEQQLLGGNLSEKEQIKARQLWTKIQEVREISKTLEDKFGVSYSDFTSDKAQNGVQNDMWKILSDKVREAYKKGDEGSGLAQEYKLLIKKMHLKPAEEDLATKLLNAAIPKEQTTKSLSVRDLFRARNPEWE